jgi:hypothetical protein
VAAVLLLVVFVGGTTVATACPMCKAGLAGEHDRLIQAWGVSIVFLLSMPFLLVTSFSAYMYILVRRARREGEARRTVPRRTDPRRTVPRQPANWSTEAEPFGQRERVRG